MWDITLHGIVGPALRRVVQKGFNLWAGIYGIDRVYLFGGPFFMSLYEYTRSHYVYRQVPSSLRCGAFKYHQAFAVENPILIRMANILPLLLGQIIILLVF